MKEQVVVFGKESQNSKMIFDFSYLKIDDLDTR
jgi:hypothetical protein